MAWNVVCLGECSKGVWEECVFCCYCIRYSIHVCYMQLIVEFNYAVTDFMSTRWVSFWQTDIEVSKCSSGLIYFFLQFIFCPNLFYSYTHTCKNYCVLESWSHCINVLPLLIPDNFTCSEVCCIWNSPAFILLVSVWNIFLYPFISFYSFGQSTQHVGS